jgi:glycosyltransferase involved in cell wall biosynthesis
MRVLFDCSAPFLLAHGGHQVQIEQTAASLRAVGVEVEMLRWWDDRQSGDVIHFFGRPSASYVRLAQGKGMRVVLAELLTAVGSRTRLRLLLQQGLIAVSRRVLPSMFTDRMNWESYRIVDGCVALTAWEKKLMHDLFGAPQPRLHVLPNGVEDVFLSAPQAVRGSWLVCTATITERKRVLELARAAAVAETPVWIVGKPYAEEDPYYRAFTEVVRANPRFVRYEGGIADRAQMAGVYREAHGFVLLSTMESLSLSALEATACECPLLLSDLPWARTVFGSAARYCPVSTSAAVLAPVLRRFYDEAPSIAPAPKPLSWIEVAGQLQAIYAEVCKTSR